MKKSVEEAWHDLENVLIQSNIKSARLLTIKNMIEVYANQKALHIAEQAVEERTCDADHPFAKFERKTAKKILSRIKTLTQ